MVIEALVASTITILAPYVAAGATKAAETLGEAMAKGAGNLLDQLRTWLNGDNEASSALRNFETNPNRYGGGLEDILSEKLKSNPAMVDDLMNIVNEVGPRVEVVQKIRTLAGQAVGLDVAKWEKGLAKVEQQVETLEKGGTLVGASIGKPE